MNLGKIQCEEPPYFSALRWLFTLCPCWWAQGGQHWERRAHHRSVSNVGRLDAMTSGCLLVTDDGALSELLTRPGGGVWKTYHALVRMSLENPNLGVQYGRPHVGHDWCSIPGIRITCEFRTVWVVDSRC